MQVYDVVIIGADHNGLVCAAYLPKADYSVLLLEKNLIPGGGAITEEALSPKAPGFKFNLCAINHMQLRSYLLADAASRAREISGCSEFPKSTAQSVLRMH